jgi:hypothetical protein
MQNWNAPFLADADRLIQTIAIVEALGTSGSRKGEERGRHKCYHGPKPCQSKSVLRWISSLRPLRES